ncbi:MAG: hypothetical protein BIFFINMI_00594 [Phycisphaerae bacterium]|nr:hypothetical protein [Phycisphaerae bacterium]
MNPARHQQKEALGQMLAKGLAEEHGRGSCVLAECQIAGFRYHDGPDIMAYLQVGDEVKLIAEPENPHDPWAVRIEHCGSRLGYLPRTHNEAVSRLLQQDVLARCLITRIDANAPPWEAVRVQVRIEATGPATPAEPTA